MLLWIEAEISPKVQFPLISKAVLESNSICCAWHGKQLNRSHQTVKLMQSSIKKKHNVNVQYIYCIRHKHISDKSFGQYLFIKCAFYRLVRWLRCAEISWIGQIRRDETETVAVLRVTFVAHIAMAGVLSDVAGVSASTCRSFWDEILSLGGHSQSRMFADILYALVFPGSQMAGTMKVPWTAHRYPEASQRPQLIPGTLGSLIISNTVGLILHGPFRRPWIRHGVETVIFRHQYPNFRGQDNQSFGWPCEFTINYVGNSFFVTIT